MSWEWGLRRRRPLNKVNVERRKRMQAKHFSKQAALCRRLPCAVRGCTRTPVHPDHVRSRGAGGSDSDCVPLCWVHHDERHQHGTAKFEERHELRGFIPTLELYAADLAAALVKHTCTAWIGRGKDGEVACLVCGGPIDPRDLAGRSEIE